MAAQRGSWHARSAAARAGAALLAAVAVALVVLVALGAAAQPARAAVAKGIVDNRLEYPGGIALAPVEGYAEEMGPLELGATWTRVLVYWDQLQPVAPWDAGYQGFDPTYRNELDTVVRALCGQGINVILTATDPPDWARDAKYEKYWAAYPTTAAVRTGDPRVRSAFRGFAWYLARHFGSLGVDHFEVWNEPNLRIRPQIVGKKVVGPEVYRRMLIAFSQGAHAANPSAVVIAGATSRFGSNGTSAGSTSPQWFARYLKDHGAAKWFDAYSHHPYTTRGSDPRPSAPPISPRNQVTLGNLTVLLKLFPSKPFYLTEFCYSTGQKDAFVVVVSPTEQASYLRQAFALLDAPAYKQVKVLLWFLVRDWQAHPDTDPELGVFSGLEDVNGVRKPAWYAFAGHNKLTVTAPAAAASGAPFDVGGTLTTRVGQGADVQVLLQTRSVDGGSWRTIGQQTTDDTGAYQFASVTQTAAARYRVVWDGVCESGQATVGLAGQGGTE